MRYLLIIPLLLFFSCGNENNYPVAPTCMDAATYFIEACLKGDFNRASFYMLQDDENKHLLAVLKQEYWLKSSKEKRAYNHASVIINDVSYVTENEVIINFKNSYDNYTRKVKVLQQKGTWIVDLKYSGNGNL